jgi:hypothetical protein
MALQHDGDGMENDPYVCRARNCNCAWVVGLMGDPEMILVDRD